MTQLMKSTALAVAIATGLTAAYAAEPLGDVVVETRTPGIEGAASYTFFPNISADLESAIEAGVVTTGLDTDSRIEVQVIELLLDGSKIAPDSEVFNEMRITVDYSHPDNAFPSKIYPIRMSATKAEVIAPANAILVDPNAPEFYKALIASTAARVIEKMPKDIDAAQTN
ncbi:hypothetical protein [uncultured Tateyamaria sp.]|uniref:hypothetical protein n=1 Tax=uncultured Tateyamaria sp. TaxID=455651 RepID=UPI00261273D6|nr:hypothetical protein [uncultured Tateyamaria sp.]